MAPRPTRRLNLIATALILLFMVVVGNLTGKMIANKGRAIVSRPKRKPKEYRYFGLQRLWTKEELEEEETSWWRVWN
jgi:hypothetical protein